jgi:hypothetical protein
LKVLSHFLHTFDLAKLEPDREFVLRAPGVVVRALSRPGKAYALYVQGRSPTTLSINLPRGRWQAEWINVEDGRALKRETILGRTGEAVSVTSPDFADAVALRLTPD